MDERADLSADLHQGFTMATSIENEMRRARSFERQGQIAAALDCYRLILRAYPKNQRARQALARMNATVDTPSQTEIKALAQLYRQGRMRELVQMAEAQIKVFPRSEPVWTLLGAAAISLEKFDQAQMAFSHAVELKPMVPTTHANLGAALERKGCFEQAVECFSRALELAPGSSDYLLFRGSARFAADDASAALPDLEASLNANPKNSQAHRILGQVLCNLDQLDRAVFILLNAVRLSPGNTDLRIDLAEVYLDLRKPEAAQEHLDKALASDPDNVRALMSAGTLCLAQGDASQAILHLKRALATEPGNALLWNNLASSQFSVGDLQNAKASADRALSIDPKHARAHHNLANVYQQAGQLDVAVNSYGTALNLAPDMDVACAQMLHFKAQMCDWSADADCSQVVGTLGITGEIVSPWPLLRFEDAPRRQLERSRRFASQWRCNRPVFEQTGNKERLRVGYFSSDLYEHATLALLNGVLEAHDNKRFEVIVYGLNAPRPSPQFERLRAAVSQYTDLHEAPDYDVVAKGRADGLDLAIDLKGYTQDARPGPFFSGIAPVQINYLGYPGSLGSGAYDYIVADETVITADQREHYTESVLYMPHSYQPNDDARLVASARSRTDHGLPEGAVVLCCFNQSYKLSPSEFNIWMRVLRQVDGSVLWLLESNKWATANLRGEAEARGVSADRLIFAKNVSQADHLARNQLADLFLDTFNVNAHTTASDALYAGLPVVTRPGAQFAARVGASLCRAVGLDELVATDDAQYEAIILGLVRDAEKRRDLRQRLATNLATAPLFDTKGYTKHLEAGYRAVWENWRDGRAPSDIKVTA